MKISLVSVIITTYKRDMSILERAINTVLNQTYPSIEIIVVNDYPPYEELIRKKVLNKYKSIKFIFHKKNQGACKSRNDGIYISAGTYIAFLDDDDEWDKTKIAKQVEVLEKTNADLVYCSGEYLYCNGLFERSTLISYPKGNLLEEILKKNFMGGCSFPLMRKSSLVRFGMFDEKFPSSQDYDLWIRFIINGNVEYIDEALVLYHVMGQSITSNIDARLKGHEMILKKYKEYYKIYPRSKASFYRTMIENGFRYKKVQCVLKIIGSSFSCFPYNYKVIFAPFTITFDYLKRALNNTKPS